MSFKVDIKGLRELEAKLKDLPERLNKEVNGIMTRGAQVFVAAAKRDAPKDFGFLTGQISFQPNPVSSLKVELVSGARYSPYLEWGTITRVNVPEAETAYAILFKGKGTRKTGGIYPRPYFFKQTHLMVATIEKGFASILKDEKL